MKKRFLSIFLSSAMVLSLLSGCAGGGGSAESTTAAAIQERVRQETVRQQVINPSQVRL